MDKQDLSKFKTSAIVREDVIDDLSRAPDEVATNSNPYEGEDFIGFKCVPKDYPISKTRFTHGGLIEPWNNKSTLTVKAFKRVNLGKAFSHELFLWFEEQEDTDKCPNGSRLHFYARNFKIIKDAEGTEY